MAKEQGENNTNCLYLVSLGANDFIVSSEAISSEEEKTLQRLWMERRSDCVSRFRLA
ncbi:hypothetical protein ACFLZP_03590 [Patescibacteria group bacterium]